MKMITHEKARETAIEIEAIVRELNRRIALAGIDGLVLEASIKVIAKIGEREPIPFIDVTVKVRPDQILPEASGGQ